MSSQFRPQFNIVSPNRWRLRVRVAEKSAGGRAKVRRALASLTRKTCVNYRCALSRFDFWARGRPVSDGLVADYALLLHGEGKAPATVRVAANAIAFREKALDRPSPRGRETRQAFRAIRRRDAGRSKGPALGLTLAQVESIIRATEDTRTLWGWRDAALVAVCFYCGLRITSHSLRRSFAQRATLMGASLQEVANMVRWKSPAVVARYCRNEIASQNAARRVFCPNES